MEVLSVFSLFLTRAGVYVGVRVYTHTHTHTAREVLGCEPRGLKQTLGEPKESRCIQSQDLYVPICVSETM